MAVQIATVPDHVGRLATLTDLQLRSNPKLDSIVDGFFEGPGAGSLTCLVIHDCGRLSSLPEAIEACTSLVALCVSQCRLAALPDSVTCLGRLRTLRAFGNALSRLPSYWSLVYLSELDLGKNDLSSLPDALCSCLQLRLLRLNRNHLVSLPDDIGRLRQLEDVDVSRNVLVELPPSVGEWRAVTRVSFADNKLKVLPETVTQWTLIQELDLERNW